MGLSFATTLRNSRANAITAARDAAVTPGEVRIYNGARPASGGAATLLLAALPFSDPSAPTAVAGVLTASVISDDTSADNTGTATWFREVDGDGVFVTDGDVGTDLVLNTNSITAGLNVSITSYVTTEGNA